MNRSIFHSSPFRPSYGLQPARYSMGQQGFVGNFFDDLTGGDVGGILRDLDDLFLKLPVDVAGNFAKKRDECIAKPLISQYKCLYDLFQEMKRAYEGKAPAPAPPPPPPPKSELPILPIAIGAVAAAALLYVAFGRG